MSPLFITVALVAGLLMIRAGTALNMLTARVSHRRCPCCGRARAGRVCTYCAHRLTAR